MKKLMIAILALMLGSFTTASAELGVNIGITGQMGAFMASGSEHEDDEKHDDSALGAVGYGSIMLEKTLGDRLTIGLDYVPYALESESTSELDEDWKASPVTTAAAAVTQKVQVDFEDLTTLYAAISITENFFVKAGSVSVDVVTNESLGTGSTYPNVSLDGSMFGAGYNYNKDSGMFIRVSGQVMTFDGATLNSTATCATRTGTCSNNKIVLDELNGVSGGITIGKSF